MTPNVIQTLALQIATNAVACAASRIHGRHRFTLQDASTVELITGLLASISPADEAADDSDKTDLDAGQGETLPPTHEAIAKVLGLTADLAEQLDLHANVDRLARERA